MGLALFRDSAEQARQYDAWSPMVLADVYYRILFESGIRFSEGTFIARPSLLEQLTALGDPHIIHRNKRAQQRKIERIFASNAALGKIIRIDDSLVERGRPMKLTANPWHAVVPNTYFHTFTFGTAFGRWVQEKEKERSRGGLETAVAEEYDEYAIPELVAWQQARTPREWACIPTYTEILQRAPRVSLRDMFQLLRGACSIFAGIPRSLRTQFFAALLDFRTRMALHDIFLDIQLGEPDDELLKKSRARALQIKDAFDCHLSKEEYDILSPLWEAFCDWRMPNAYVERMTYQLRALLFLDRSRIPLEFREARIDPRVYQRYANDLQRRRPTPL